MRFHTDKLTFNNIYDAAELAKVHVESPTRHNSKSRDHSFDIHLRGLSRRRPNFYNGDGQYAATWDQWGVFMGMLFELDPDMQINSGLSAESYAKFTWRTDCRFNLAYRDNPVVIPFPLNHDHTFRFSGTLYTHSCTKCGAIQRWDW